MEINRESVSKILDSSPYRRLRSNVNVGDDKVTVVQFFHCDELARERGEEVPEDRTAYVKDCSRDYCDELFQGTGFEYADNAYGCEGSRVLIHSLRFKAPNFEKDLSTVLKRMSYR